MAQIHPLIYHIMIFSTNINRPKAAKIVFSGNYALKHCIFFFFSLFSVGLAAQAEPPTNAYLKGLQPETRYCAAINFNSVVPLKIKGVYRIYANVDEDNKFFPADIWLEDMSGDTYEVSFLAPSNTYVSEEIPEGKSVILKYIDGCSELVEDKTSITDYSLGQIITVSNKLFSLVVDINALEKRSYEDILNVVLNDKEVDHFEKLSFIQQYLLKGNSLFSEKLQGINNHPSFEKLQDECNCTVISTYFANTPGTHLQTVQNEPSSRTITTSQVAGQSNELEFNLRSSGPAKLWHLYSDGWKRSRNTWMGGAMGAQVGRDGNGFPSVDPINDTYLNDGLSLPTEFIQNASIRMILTCNNGVQVKECGCAKQIQPTALYESEIGVRTQTLDGGGGTKRAIAMGEDAAILYRQVLSGENAGEFELLGTDIFQMSSFCNSDVNPEFFSSILDVFGDAAQIALGFTNLTPDSTANIRAQVDEFLSSLDTLTSTPRRIVSGDCAFASGSRRFEFPVNAIYLRPSELTQFALASRSRGMSMGMRSWQSEVLIKSDYRLAVFQPRGKKAIQSSNSAQQAQCCTEKASVAWIYGLIDAQSDVPTGNMGLSSDPISTHFDMRADLGDALLAFIGESSLFPYEFGRHVVPYQWGQLVGRQNAKEGCKVTQNDEVPPVVLDGDFDPDLGRSDNPWGDKSLSNSDLTCRHTIYSVDGRKIGDLTGTLIVNANGEKTLNVSSINDWLSSRNLSSGIYLVSSLDVRGSLVIPTKKIILTK